MLLIFKASKWVAALALLTAWTVGIADEVLQCGKETWIQPFSFYGHVASVDCTLYSVLSVLDLQHAPTKLSAGASSLAGRTWPLSASPFPLGGLCGTPSLDDNVRSLAVYSLADSGACQWATQVRSTISQTSSGGNGTRVFHGTLSSVVDELSTFSGAYASQRRGASRFAGNITLAGIVEAVAGDITIAPIAPSEEGLVCTIPAGSGLFFAALLPEDGSCAKATFIPMPHVLASRVCDADRFGATYTAVSVLPSPLADIAAPESAIILGGDCGTIQPPSYGFLLLIKMSADLECMWYYTFDFLAVPDTVKRIDKLSSTSTFLQQDSVPFVKAVTPPTQHLVLEGINADVNASVVLISGFIRLVTPPPVESAALSLNLTMCQQNEWYAPSGQPSAAVTFAIGPGWQQTIFSRGNSSQRKSTPSPIGTTLDNQPVCLWSHLIESFYLYPTASSKALDSRFVMNATGYYQLGMIQVAFLGSGCNLISLTEPRAFVAFFQVRRSPTYTGKTNDPADIDRSTLYPDCRWVFILPPALQATQVLAVDDVLILAGNLTGTVQLGTACGTLVSRGGTDGFIAKFDAKAIAANNREVTSVTDPVWAQTCISAAVVGSVYNDTIRHIARDDVSTSGQVVVGGLVGPGGDLAGGAGLGRRGEGSSESGNSCSNIRGGNTTVIPFTSRMLLHPTSMPSEAGGALTTLQLAEITLGTIGGGLLLITSIFVGYHFRVGPCSFGRGAKPDPSAYLQLQRDAGQALKTSTPLQSLSAPSV